MSPSPYDDGWLLYVEELAPRHACTVNMMSMTIPENIKLACAQAAHEMNRLYCEAIGDTSQTPWDRAQKWQQSSALEGVDQVFAGATPEQLHESWVAEKKREGWKWGPKKDPDLREHHCMVPYAELSMQQRQKDALFSRAVNAMAMALGFAVLPDLRRAADPEAHSTEAPAPRGTVMTDTLLVKPRPA